MGKIRARQNYAANRNVRIEGVINNQRVRPASELRYGAASTPKHGSGWVSVYNALYLLSRNVSPAKIIRSIEEIGGTIMGGTFGTKYQELIPVLSEYGYMSRIHTQRDGFNNVIPVGSTGILVYRNMRQMNENNFVAFRRVEEKRYDFFNPTTKEVSIEAFLTKRHSLRFAKVILIRNRTVMSEAMTGLQNQNDE